MIFKWAWREIRNHRLFVLMFTLNLSLGLVGFLCLDAFKVALDQSLKSNAQVMLSGDIAISARRILSSQELKPVKELLESSSVESHLWEFFSMTAAQGQSRLVQVKAIDENYPLYGELNLRSGKKIEGSTVKEVITEPRAWVYPELLAQLGLQVGDSIKLGEVHFLVSDVIDEDKTQTFRLASLAPRVYVGLGQIQKAKLIGFGSTVSDIHLFKLDMPETVAEVKSRVNQLIPDTSIRIETAMDASDDSGRALRYLSDYLGLVSMVALFLASLGTAYLFRSYIVSRSYEIAILNALGLGRGQAQKIYLLQLAGLGFVSSLISLSLSFLLLPALTALLAEFSPMNIAISLSMKTVVLAILMGTLGSAFSCWPFLLGSRRVKVRDLLVEGGDVQSQQRAKDLWAFLPGLIFYWLLAIWQANSLQTGSWFVIFFFSSFLLLLFLGYGFQMLIPWLRPPSWIWRQALLVLSRKKASTLSVMVAIGLGSLLINLMPQLKASLKEELAAPQNMKLPSLFLFDIQDEQMAPLQQWMQSQGHALASISPMVRARILKINDRDFEKTEAKEFATREEEAEARFRNRGVNLSYREKISEAEDLSAGKWWTGPASTGPGASLPELSLETRYAERLGIAMGDILSFDIQGVEIQGRVGSLRKVRWNSFQPNFFILFQPGVLEEAPKTFLASVPQMSMEETQNLQNKLVAQFPNVSMIDVARTVARIFEVSEKMSWSLELMAFLSILAGFIVLYSIASQQALSRRWDLNMMKVMGASPRQVKNLLRSEFFVLGLLSSASGVLLSVVISYLLSQQLFEGQFDFYWREPLLTLVLVSGMSVFIAELSARKIVNEKPLALLNR